MTVKFKTKQIFRLIHIYITGLLRKLAMTVMWLSNNVLNFHFRKKTSRLSIIK